MSLYGARAPPIIGLAPPYGGTAPFPQTTPQQAATIQPGPVITYTTTTAPDGRFVYHPFKCVRPPRVPIV